MRAFLIFILCLVTATIGWLAGANRPGPATTPDHESPVTSGMPLSVNSVHGLGKLQPQSGIVKIVAPPGQQVDSIFDLQVGQSVKIGDKLVMLSGRNANQTKLDLAKARKFDAKSKLDFEKKQGQFKRAAAELALQEAVAADEVIASKQKSITLLSEQKRIAEQSLVRLQRLSENDATRRLINRTDIDKQTLLVKTLETQLRQAHDEIAMARAKSNRAQKAAILDLENVDYAIQSAENAVPNQTIDQSIQAAQLAVKMTTIESPIDATVLDIIVRPGDSVTNQPVMLIGDVSNMVCVAEINDSQMRYVTVGSRVTITSLALTKPITGTVQSKGVMIGPPSIQDPNPFASVDRRTGKVVIVLDDSDVAREFVNLQVEVDIEIQTDGDRERDSR